MASRSRSPLRRHVLSSLNINPNAPQAEPAAESADGQAGVEEAGASATASAAKRRKLRFKSSHSGSRSRRDPLSQDGHAEDASSTSARHHRHHHRRRSSHRKRPRSDRSRSRSPTPSNPFDPPPLDPEAAFRESLFDAMADDEGAAYWEGVYGQPLHSYPRPARPSGPEGAGGERLEEMNDEEYAAHVRRKMWERTHEGMMEERRRRAQERRATEDEERQREREGRKGRRLAEEMERSLRRGEDRRRRRERERRWAEYVRGWREWDSDPDPGRIPWPTESGKREDVGEEAVRTFIMRGLEGEEERDAVDDGRGASVEGGRAAKSFSAKLKDERVRWHPDKVQQRLGGQVDEKVMQSVTAIFQIVDRMWSDTRAKA